MIEQGRSYGHLRYWLTGLYFHEYWLNGLFSWILTEWTVFMNTDWMDCVFINTDWMDCVFMNTDWLDVFMNTDWLDNVFMNTDWLNCVFMNTDWLDYVFMNTDWLDYFFMNTDWLDYVFMNTNRFFAAPKPPGKTTASNSAALRSDKALMFPRAIRADSASTFLKHDTVVRKMMFSSYFTTRPLQYTKKCLRSLTSYISIVHVDEKTARYFQYLRKI